MLDSEVDEAVAAANAHDGTRGRGLNGHISNALEQQSEHEVIKNAV